MQSRPDHHFAPFDLGAEAWDSHAAPNETDKFDWNDPAAFFKAIGAGRPGAVPFPEIWSKEDVRREATTWSDRISTSYETLHAILQRHEPTIQKRWLKKTRAQRLKILLTAWPRVESERHESTQYRECFMWPYINQEDLLNTKALPLLLNARGRHPPSTFAAADIDAMHLGVVTKAIVPIFLNEHVLMLNGMTENTHEYGRLVAWDDHPDAFHWMHKQQQFHPGEGLVVLEAQGRLLTFLVQCSREILHDIPESSLFDGSFPILLEPQLKPESEISGFESLGVMAAEAPYRVPAQLDLGRIASLLTARASAAEDHLWALREDPGYFANMVLEAKEHRQEMLKDLDGKNHPVLVRGRQEILWGRVIRSMVSDAYLGLEMFSELSSQAKELFALQRVYTDGISPSEDLPAEYLEALLRFHHYLNQVAKGLLSKLKLVAVAAPPMRRLFAREPPPDAHTTKMAVVARPGSKMNKVEKQLIWLLRTLWENSGGLFLAGLPLIVDELERLLQSDTAARELVSAYVTEIIGDLSIVSQCLKQLSLYHPWARSWESELVDREDKLKQEYAERTRSWGRILAALDVAIPATSSSSRAVNLGDPSDGKFNYPIARRRNKENVEALRKAESHLDAFWAAIDQVMVTKAGDLHDTAMRALLSQSRILQRTAEWVEPGKPQPARSAQPKSSEVDGYGLYQHISTIYSGFSPRTLDLAQPKAKAKTRGKPRPTATHVDEAEALLRLNPADRQPTFTVDGRAFKVFRTIFFNPALMSTPGEVPWNDFLHAMTSVGFTVMKLYGSVWQFQPTRLDVERSIQFHEPHPRGKLPFTTARRYGRRLHRAYGWFGGMFVLDKKPDDIAAQSL
ncbi:hypothetical protein ASPCADRAFT_409080 [Aspergillus carbonarius ITEM 5010]|uniref:Uncharacterized protein n=1 Tax=Aspergillus carbonarius (strain ITEM 5010) TaxID=602072 RepID=A0A1R3RBZ0_ASPC5|nr:hypothetical protein ASPCADRAFT_409080 [Aspergillus carbonarius ITEM 5010]